MPHHHRNASQNLFLCGVQTDYLIIGQGICGTLLSWKLRSEGKNVIVIDEARPSSSSRVASGLMNPITGKRLVKTWMADVLLPAAAAAYRAFENELGVPILSEYDILDFHGTPQEHDLFLERMEQETEALFLPAAAPWEPCFHNRAGLGGIASCGLVDMHALLSGWRQKLRVSGALLEETFDWSVCKISNGQVRYKDITAERIICCEGPDGFDNPYFSRLPYSRNKGEAVLAEIPDLPRTHIFRQGLKIVPWQEGLFWIGASFEWTFTESGPTETFLRSVHQTLGEWLKLPYTIREHWASERPATVGHRPFVGFHPLYPEVGVLNGTGTKGCSLAPYFAQQLTQHLLKGTPIAAEADVQRFTRILSRA